MGALRHRLNWDSATGALHDGPRRYLMLRPDVLMGALGRLDDCTRAAMLQALAASVQQHGAESLRAYTGQVGGNGPALLAATIEAAADLGWGRWALRHEADMLTLEVSDSPFVAGWHAARPNIAATDPVCAAISGMLAGLASIILGGPVQAQEGTCAATLACTHCRFVAKRTP